MQLEADLGSMLIIWARAGALQTPLQPPKITLCTYCGEDKPLWFNAARLIGVEDGLHQKRRLLRCFGDDA